jgi:hypothetical protein
METSVSPPDSRGTTRQIYNVQWECSSCGHTQTFRRGFNEDDGWPNKLDDLECENQECGHVQDVAFRDCTVVLIEGSEDY